MSNDIELLACPFCGAGVTKIRESHNGYHVDHWCEKHQKVTIQCTADDLDSAKNLWNARAALAAPQKEPVALDFEKVNEAAQSANKQFGQWMPERWIQLFVAAYNKE